MRRLSNVVFLLMMIFLMLLIGGMTLPACFEESITPFPRPEPPEIVTDNPVKLVFTGDIMLARNVGEMIESDPDKDYSFLFVEQVAEYLRDADIAFANLESIITEKGYLNSLKSPPHFKASPDVVNGLLFAGIDIVSVANNHAFDYGRAAMEDSFNNLRRAGIQDVGGGFNAEEAYTPIIYTINSEGGEERLKIAYLAFNQIGDPAWAALQENSGIAWLYRQNLESAIYKARVLADIVIVSMHFGTENQTLPKNEDQDMYAHLAIDRGADIVIGHHPHVIQPVMVYTGKYIAYSLGNFIFDQSSEETHEGMVLEVLIQDKEIKEVIPKYYTINEFYQPIFVE